MSIFTRDFNRNSSYWTAILFYLVCGLLLLLLARREPTLSLTGVELSGEAVSAARANFRANGLEGTLLEGDFSTAPLPLENFDLVVSNPPYFAPRSGKGSDPARMEGDLTLEGLCRRAGALLRHGGRFALVHRPERLADLFAGLRGAALEPKRLQFLQHDAAHAPSAVLVESVKGGRPGLECLPAAFAAGPI